MMTVDDMRERANDAVFCLHCDGEFKARELRVTRGEYVLCADRNCDGSGFDLDFEPWWRE